MDPSKTPIEKTVKYATSVKTMPEAFAFVMEYMEKVGPSPSICIHPSWWFGADEDPTESEGTLTFTVLVEGMTEESKSDGGSIPGHEGGSD